MDDWNILTPDKANWGQSEHIYLNMLYDMSTSHTTHIHIHMYTWVIKQNSQNI